MTTTTTSGSSVGNEAASGLKNTTQPTESLPPHLQGLDLEPWDVAEMLLPTENAQTVSVEYASDAVFEAWIVSQGIPVDNDGITEWTFDDRYGVIIYALFNGLTLHFADKTIPSNSSETIQNTELFEEPQAALQEA